MCRKQIGYKDIQDVSSTDGLLRVNKEFSLFLFDDGTYDISYIYGSEWIVKNGLTFEEAKEYIMSTFNLDENQTNKYLNQSDFNFLFHKV